MYVYDSMQIFIYYKIMYSIMYYFYASIRILTESTSKRKA